MGICTRRHFLLSVCILQMISTVVRQVFDFLGYMWIPILINFFEIIFIIFGFFGAFQYQQKYVISYSVWNVVLLAWNLYLVCLYLDIGILNHQENKVLKLDPESASWWENNGPGCKVIYNTTSIPKPASVTDCLFHYVHIEVFHASVQCLLAFLGSVTGLCLKSNFHEENYGSSHSNGRKPSKRTSLYSIEFSPQHNEGQQDSDSMEYGNGFENLPPPVSPKPMTPRRVKRRSVMTRGTTSRLSTNSRHNARSSVRSSKRIAQNPVTQIIDQQQKATTLAISNKPAAFDGPVLNSTPNTSSEHVQPGFIHTYTNTPPQSQQQQHQQQQQQHQQQQQPGQWQINGHTNPTYQQSSNQSLNEHDDDLDDLYNNRPASVRSSYSNFHGTRTISYGVPQYYHSHATPQVPQKRNANVERQSLRSLAFMKNGPPAYTIQGQNSADSETTI